MANYEIMTLEEVARYLRVSERTVYDWAHKGVLPGGKLGTTWRFKRSELEHWVDERLGSRRTLRHEGVAIRDVLAPERVLLLEGVDKRTALEALTHLLADTPEVQNPDELERELFERERLMSTGIGFGIGVPHVRLGSVSDLVMAVGVSREPLADYESLDGEPVRIVCMLAAHKNQHALYLKILAAVSNILKLDFVRQAILEAEDPQTVYELLTHPVAES